MRYLLIALSLLLLPAAAVRADVSVGIGIATPGLSIGFNVPAYPRLVPVPGYPIYYAPGVDLNFFFYDGLYWVFYGDNWYVSDWYNGPWRLVAIETVPLFLLRVPVRYYRVPPPYFRGWHRDAPPRWGEHWGRDWQERHRGWERWNRRSVPPPAPLPSYQRDYSRERYPTDPDRQRSIRSERYRFEPREDISREHFQMRGGEQGKGRRDDRGDGPGRR